MFDGDIRLGRVERVMKIVRQMTLAEMKSLYKEIAFLHDSVVLANDPRWKKPEDPHWEKDL